MNPEEEGTVVRNDGSEGKGERDRTTPRAAPVDLSRLGMLRDRIDPSHEPFDLEQVRRQLHNPSLRD